jgi:phage shock protein A
MSTESIDQLIEKRKELEAQAEELQVRSVDRRFVIELDDRRTIKTIMEHLDRGFTWKTQNAAIIVTLHDNLKKQYREVDPEAETGAKVSIQLRGHELNGLYQALLNVEGSGIENARRFIKMLTSVGEAVTTAMKELGEMNKQITELHQQLSVLDAEIDQAQAATEAVTPELITDETEK